MPNKPHKWGFKLWVGVSSYLYDFDICQDKANDSDTHNLGVSAGVIMKMPSSLPDGHNFKWFADN